MNIVICSSEVFPFAKTGGLADVTGALSIALGKLKNEVKVFMPLYKNIKPDKLYDDYGLTKEGNVEFIFIKNDVFFYRDGLYGTSSGDYSDNLERFCFFSKKVLEIIKRINFKPDIVHSHDWQAAPVIIYLKTIYKDDEFYKNAKTILTIHNLAYQGIFNKEKYEVIGISWDYFNMHCLEFYDKVNLLKGGIVFADAINTVSPNYAKQIQTPQYGCGLDGVLRERANRLFGILNAIDYSVWDPKIDNLIYKKYSPENLEDKYINKKKLQSDLGLLVDKNKFLLGMVSRLAEQKGIDIISNNLEELAKNYQLVILGVGDERYHQILKKFSKKFKKSFSLNLKFDETLAHRIYAGCDAFLLPSRFEPCGLSQMISYKYATVPIVHHTGGLADTVVDYEEEGGGFVFKEYSTFDFLLAVERAYKVFKKKKEWLNLLKKITKYNFSWDVSAKQYIKLYNSL